MSRFLILFCYNLLLPVFFLIAFPAWLLKMWRRGGYGTGLLERFAKFSIPASDEPRDVIYVHAVSVGEVIIAIKLINAWLAKYPEHKIVLAATTSTGHEIACEKSPESVRVIYSPLDFGFIVSAVLRRFRPRQIVLIEAEAWPNLLNIAYNRGIPIAMVNARLSARSEARFLKFSTLVKPLFGMIDLVCVQNNDDIVRFENLGILREKIHVTGSIKFDPCGGEVPAKRDSFQAILDDFSVDHSKRRLVVIAASTHAGEEKLIGEAHLAAYPEALYIAVPRHAERRAEVSEDLNAIGFEVVLRSDYHKPLMPEKACLVVDTTGELRDWIAHADLVIIGKSWLGVGGQNPAEAIIAGVPVLCGPHMENFEPLVTMLREAGGIKMLDSADELGSNIHDILTNTPQVDKMTLRARSVLVSHQDAVEKTIEFLNFRVSVRERKEY